MIPVPIPADVPGHRLVLGEPGMNPADPDAPMPAEYLIGQSVLYRGRPTFTALVLLQPEDIAAIAAGARHLWLTLDGGEVPWGLAIADDPRLDAP